MIRYVRQRGELEEGVGMLKPDAHVKTVTHLIKKPLFRKETKVRRCVFKR